MNEYKVTEWLYVTRDWSQLADRNSPEAAFLLAAPGQVISLETARAYGLVNDKGAPVVKKLDSAPENKQRRRKETK